MPDSLNARMAAALAPVLGEAAVYAETVYICSNGHINTRYYKWGNECIECDVGVRDYSIQLPVDFADPAVGWGLWERWHALPENETCEMVIARNIRHHFLVRLIFPEASGRRLGYGYADKVLSALLAAWAQVLEVEEVSGDA